MYLMYIASLLLLAQLTVSLDHTLYTPLHGFNIQLFKYIQFREVLMSIFCTITEN